MHGRQGGDVDAGTGPGADEILDSFDDERIDPSTELGAHTIIEAIKLALADRDAYFEAAPPWTNCSTTPM